MGYLTDPGLTNSGNTDVPGIIHRAEVLAAAAELPSGEITAPAELLEQLHATSADLIKLASRQWVLSTHLATGVDAAIARVRRRGRDDDARPTG